MKKELIVSVVFVLILSVSACHNRSVIPEVDAIEIAHITSLPDSSFFSDLRHLTISDERLYALDIERRQVLSVDKKFEDLWIFGSGGRGPTELLAPFSFAVHDDSVFVYDLSTLSVKTYTKEGFQGKKDLGFVLNDYRWYERDGEFWMPVHNSDSLFVNISPKGDRFFGKPRRFGSDKKLQ